jgi:hypothetical protein
MTRLDGLGNEERRASIVGLSDVSKSAGAGEAWRYMATEGICGIAFGKGLTLYGWSLHSNLGNEPASKGDDAMETSEAKRIRELEALLDEAFGQIDFWMKTAEEASNGTMPLIRPSLSIYTRLVDERAARPDDYWQKK